MPLTTGRLLILVVLAHSAVAVPSWAQPAGPAGKLYRGERAEQPARFELLVNLNAAKGLSLTTPPSLLAQADGVVE